MIYAVVTWDAFWQLTASGIFRGAAYGLLGAGFALILGVTGRFHFHTRVMTASSSSPNGRGTCE